MSTVSVELQLKHVVTRLQQSYPELHEGEVRAIVAAAWHDLDGARLRQFVPLLVERSAKAACRERSGRRPHRPEPDDGPVLDAGDGRRPGAVFVLIR